MKKLNVIYNHNIFDSPYKQSEVRKTDKEIKSVLGDDVIIYVTHTCLSDTNPFFPDSDLIMVEHTFEMNSAVKKSLAFVLNKSVTKIKKEKPIDVIVSFIKINDDDLYYFENGEEIE